MYPFELCQSVLNLQMHIKQNKRALGPWIIHLILAYKMMYWPVAKEISFKVISIFSSGGHVVQLS